MMLLRAGAGRTLRAPWARNGVLPGAPLCRPGHRVPQPALPFTTSTPSTSESTASASSPPLPPTSHHAADAPSVSAGAGPGEASWTPTSDVGIETELQQAFSDAEKSFAHLSLPELVRANFVLQACRMAGPLVPYIDKLYGAAVSLTGPGPVHQVMRPTAFAHFCGGEQASDMLPKLQSLQEYGIGGILDYAAEAKEGAVGDESRFDSQIALFAEAVSVAAQGGSEYNLVAIKISALCDVSLLIKASQGLVEAQRTFFRLAEAEAQGGEEDAWGVPFSASPATVLSAEAVALTWPVGLDLAAMDARGAGQIDLVDWTTFWTPARVNTDLANCAYAGSFPALTGEELARLARAEERIDTVCSNARRQGVRLLVDAEWSKAQPAMDFLALRASARHNMPAGGHETATVLQTYQCYLRGSLGRCERDLVRARREGWSFGAKLVRGAYIVQERAEAAEAGRISPVWDCLAHTEENYHAVIASCLASHRRGDQVMVASHNTDSLLFTVQKMREFKLDPQTCGVLFAQLLGMAEAASFALAKHGYRVFKYMPYGPLDEVVPYLLRRTQENSTLLGTPAVRKEREMLLEEVWRRSTGLDVGWAIRSK